MHQDPVSSPSTLDDSTRLPVVYCPECGMPAWIEWRDLVGSSGGAVTHVKVRCFARHWFLMPEDRLTDA